MPSMTYAAQGNRWRYRHEHTAATASAAAAVSCSYLSPGGTLSGRCRSAVLAAVRALLDEPELHCSGCSSQQWQLLILSRSPPLLRSLPVPTHAAALRAVDGGGGGEALHPAGEGRGVSASTCLRALRPLVHGGGGRRALGAGCGPGVHASGPGFAGQHVSVTWGSRGVDF